MLSVVIPTLNSESGLADYLAVDEMDALRIGRDIVSHLRWRKLGPGPTEPADEPLYDPADLYGAALSHWHFARKRGGKCFANHSRAVRSDITRAFFCSDA